MQEKLEQLIERVGGRRRAGILGAGVGAVLLILGLSWWATAPEWVPAFSGLPLESVGEVTKRLDEAKVAYRLEGNGTEIRVASTDLARARVILAEGGLPASGRPGLELFDQPSWGMTDFTQRINYRRALEGELERTVGKMRGVESAQVHLAIQESSSFRRQEGPGEASVVLRLRGGQAPDQEVVRGVQHLVASSVGGLESGNVTILDDAGRLLSAPNEPGSLAALTHRQLEMQREVERHLEGKAGELLAQILGPGNARVEVSAEINFDRVERTMESVDPEGQVSSNEQVSEIIPGPQGGAGSRTASTTYDNSRKLETFSGSVGGVRRLTVAVLVNDLAGVAPAGETPAKRAPEEVAQIQTLVERAVGFDAERGDQVSVVSMPFTSGKVETGGGMGMNAWDLAHEFHKPVLTLIALLLAFFVALRVIRTLRPESTEVAVLPARDVVEALPPEGAEVLQEVPVAEEPLPAPVIAPALPSSRQRVEMLIEAQPEVAVRLVRGWLQEGKV